MALSVIVVLLPSGWIFYDVVRETVFLRNANRFIAENIAFEGAEIINKKLVYNDTLPRIDIYIMGEIISEEAQMQLRKQMPKYDLAEVSFRIHQPKDYAVDLAGKLSQEVRVGVLEDIYDRNARMMEQKDATIGRLSAIVERDSIPFENLYREVRIQYPEVKRLAYARTIEMGRDGEMDSIPTLLVRWDNEVLQEERSLRESTMKEWLKVRLELDTLRIIRF
jgi:hypothetical protein